MFFDDKKKADVGAILKMRKPAQGPAPEPEGLDPLHAISEELIEALHARDAAGVMHALHAFMLEASTKE